MVWYRRRWAYRRRRWADRRERCCRSRREWFATIGFGFGFGALRMVLPEPSRMVCDDWVWVLGSDHREWSCRGRCEWFAMIGFEFGFGPSRMVLPDRREWFCRTVANGYRRRFRSYRRRWGSTAIGFGSEAWRRLGLGVFKLGFWFLKNHNWMGLGVLSFLYIY